MKRFLVLPAVLAFTALLWTPGHTMLTEASAAPEIDQPLDQLTGDAFERAFLAQMTMHHGMAVMMAQPVVTNADHEELKGLAQSIIADQTREIAQMRAWASAWFGLALPDPVAAMGGGMMAPTQIPMNGHGGDHQAHRPAAPDMPSDHAGAMPMMADLGKLPAKRLEVVFMSLMIPHHEGAVSMANLALERAAHQEIHDLARQIIASQTAEIEQMNAWLATWYGL